MKSVSQVATRAAAAAAAAAAMLPALAQAQVQGFDISSYQPNVNFAGAYSSGARFVIIKATEGTNIIDSTFSSHYDSATSAGFIRGAYHFARPNEGSGAAQANYFHAHGGGWSGDGITLPGMLDIEYGPSGSECYGLSASAMESWIADFVDTYHSLTTRWPIIYTTADWWDTCTGNSKQFSSTCPLNLANYNPSISNVPGGWPYQTIWQYNDKYSYGGDSDRFNGAESSLKKLATG